jgi:hypothetical protein
MSINLALTQHYQAQGDYLWDLQVNPSASGKSNVPNPSGLTYHLNHLNGLYIQHRNDETCQYCQSQQKSLPNIQVLPDYHYKDTNLSHVQHIGQPTCRVDRLTIPAKQCPKCKDDFALRTSDTPIVGFRGWKVTEETKWIKLTPFSKPRKQVTGVVLNAAGYHGAWNGREPTMAKCANHKAPNISCACGLYIYKQPDWMDYGGNAGEVQGAVVAWGHMVEHQEGFKAEWAQPIFIFDPRGIDHRPGKPIVLGNDERYLLAKRVSEFLQLPLVPFDKEKVAAIAREYGDIMP